MLRRIGSTVRSQWIGMLALFVALGGTALAAGAINGPAPGTNSVGSLDIIDGQVQPPDLRENSVSGAKVLNSSLRGADIGDASVTGADINEATLNLGPEPVHKVGDPGEPAFNTGVSNQVGDFVPAGFYKDRFGRVFLQGTVHTTGPRTLFTLPAGYRPAATVCTLAPGFDGPGTTLQFSRICVQSSGTVAYFNGAGTSYLSLDGISLRAAG